MSSLMQFGGEIRGGKVGLIFSLGKRGQSAVVLDDCDTFTCPECGREHPNLYVAFRKPAGMLGCWVVFRWCGEEHVPDLSIPIQVERLPRDARMMPVAKAARHWHS